MSVNPSRAQTLRLALMSLKDSRVTVPRRGSDKIAQVTFTVIENTKNTFALMFVPFDLNLQLKFAIA